MLVIGIDFETSGLNAETDRVIEIGAVLWDTDTGMPLQIMSEFCLDEGTPNPLPPEIEQITGITYEMLKSYARETTVHCFCVLADLITSAEAIIAHNGAIFDRGFYLAETKRLGLPPIERVWIDTAMDIKYPAHITTRKLMHLAAEHGFLNPFSHRAVFDVLTMLRVFQNYDAEAALEYAKQPMITVQSLVSFDDKDKAKERGYRWKPETKQWLKNMRTSDFEIEKQEAGFNIRIVES